MAKRINIYMKQRLFEDDQSYDVSRHTTGIGSEIMNQGPVIVNPSGANKNKGDEHTPNKLFPVSSIESTMADAFVNISNVEKLLQVARDNPSIDNKKIVELSDILKNMTSLLVDFDEKLSIIKDSNGK